VKITSKARIIPILLTLALAIFLIASATVMAAEPTVGLGTTASYAVLAGETITN
jgi:hypothetical protein